MVWWKENVSSSVLGEAEGRREAEGLPQNMEGPGLWKELERVS